MVKQTAHKEKVAKNTKALQMTSEAKQLLFDKQRENLPKFIKKRQKEFVKLLEDYKIATIEGDQIDINGTSMNVLELTDRCFDPILYDISPSKKYSADQLTIIFDYYRNCCRELNKTTTYVPNKEDFCRLLGVSTDYFERLKYSNIIEMREVVARIKDWISSHISQGAFQEKIEKNYSIFYQKASLGRRDNDPIQVNNFTQNNTIVPEEQFKELLSKYSNEISGSEK